MLFSILSHQLILRAVLSALVSALNSRCSDCDSLTVQGKMWATALEGIRRRTFFVAEDESIGTSISSNVACARDGTMRYGLDKPDEFPAVWDGQAAVPLVSSPRVRAMC
jgi:hypothetical protein